MHQSDMKLPSTNIRLWCCHLVINIVLNLSTSNTGALVLTEVFDGRIQSLLIKITDSIN